MPLRGHPTPVLVPSTDAVKGIALSPPALIATPSASPSTCVSAVRAWSRVVAKGGARRWSGRLVASPEHLVGLEEERRGKGQAQGLGSLEVDAQVARDGPLHGQLSGLGASEALVDEGCRAPDTSRQRILSAMKPPASTSSRRPGTVGPGERHDRREGTSTRACA
jgi:hypothetical protein